MFRPRVFVLGVLIALVAGTPTTTAVASRVPVGEPVVVARRETGVDHATRVPAFRGAVGFGADTRAGRGGRVVEVRNLRGAGPGSLRAALTAQGRRTVVFRVGGTIQLQRSIDIRHPYLTVAGQTAPGDGIAVRGATLDVRTHDVVVRYLRVRPGAGRGAFPGSRDGIRIRDTVDQQAHDIVIDHCSVSWAIDENMDLWRAPRDITIQWSILSEGLRRSRHPEGVHSMGLLVSPRTRRLSLHHNLFVANNGRNPVLFARTRAEVVNNVITGWAMPAPRSTAHGSGSM